MSTRDISLFKNADLLLNVTSSIDPNVFDIGRYEAFLDALCSTRSYQKAAIHTVCNYFLGQIYRDQADLARRNWGQNATLRDKHVTFERFRTALPFPDKLACSVDHATGTGKSFVMYGIARILLAEGAADQVLVLCPSKTIEAGLTDKFRELSADLDMTALLPSEAAVRTPHIINATESIVKGSICVENIHATYKATGSSIRDSLGGGRGARTLVLNDEAHHIYSPDAHDEGLKKWKEFLEDPEFDFRYVAGFSGTSYIGNEYFPDVVARYSLAEAIEERGVKIIEYVAEDSAGDQYEKFQKVYHNHKQHRTTYKAVRPLTIFITKDIPRCRRLTDEFVAFLAKKEGCTLETATEKVLVVTSHKDHAKNVTRLRTVEPDSKTSKIEWLFSVSMLTEGWDVKNVFQIVPDQERAFNSKLLIAQVLGRGLRVPPAYADASPKVVVLNHDNWSTKIKHLVEEVLEQERRISCFPANKVPDFNFLLHTIAYDRAEDVVSTTQEQQYNFTMGYVELAAQAKELTRETVYETALTGQRRTQKTRVQFEMIPLEEAVADVYNKFKSIDLEEGTAYARTYTKKKIRELIRRSLDRIGYSGDELSKENRQRVLSAFGNLNRVGNKSIRYKVTPRAVEMVSTSARPRDSIGLAMLRRTATVFYDEASFLVDAELAQILRELEDEGELGSRRLHRSSNSYNFRTPLSVVLASSEPERRFVAALIKQENAQRVTAWVKSTDSGFYEIEYSYSKGEYSRRACFNPDFFIKVGTDVVVVEVKDESEVSDPSPENRGKLKAARVHFDQLNNLQQEARYHFSFLTPSDYDVFFEQLRAGKHMAYQSNLDVALMTPSGKS